MGRGAPGASASTAVRRSTIPLPSVVMKFLQAYVEMVLVKQVEKVRPETPIFWSTCGRRAGWQDERADAPRASEVYSEVASTWLRGPETVKPYTFQFCNLLK